MFSNLIKEILKKPVKVKYLGFTECVYNLCCCPGEQRRTSRLNIPLEEYSLGYTAAAMHPSFDSNSFWRRQRVSCSLTERVGHLCGLGNLTESLTDKWIKLLIDLSRGG